MFGYQPTDRRYGGVWRGGGGGRGIRDLDLGTDSKRSGGFTPPFYTTRSRAAWRGKPAATANCRTPAKVHAALALTVFGPLVFPPHRVYIVREFSFRLVMDTELERGIERLAMIFESERTVKLSAPEPNPGGFAFIFIARGYGKEWRFSLLREALSDLPAMQAYQQGALRFARALGSRFRNKSPGFFCISSVPLLLQIEWPWEPLRNRAASYVRVAVTDSRDGRLAYCYVVITHQQSMFDLKPDPFLVNECVVNSIRLAVDSGLVKFYPQQAHPIELQEVKLRTRPSTDGTGRMIDDFLRQKVFWLAFKAGDSSSITWIADPWDAAYLGTTVSSLRQAGQILEARSELQLDQAKEFASIGRELLACARKFEFSESGKESDHRPENDNKTWDVFICHATEDKEAFVRPLAEALRKRGFHVWFDEYTLRLGDSLRRSIDRGLSASRFGIVVLSPAFFSKEWPQKELDGLVSRESGGKRIILPVWHNVTAADVRMYSPTLSDRFAVASSEGLLRVVDMIAESASGTAG